MTRPTAITSACWPPMISRAASPEQPGEDKTVGYLIENFRKLGLKPGNGASYVQQVPLVQITASADATLTVTGAAGSRNLRVRQGHGDLVQARGAGNKVAHSEMVFVGYGIVAPEYSWNDYANLDVHGKTVVVLGERSGLCLEGPHGVQRRRHDRIRPRCLQGRGGGAAGRRGRVVDPRCGGHGLRLECGSEHLERCAVRTASGGRGRRPRRDRRLAAERCGASAVQCRGNRLRANGRGGGASGLQSRAAGAARRCDGSQRDSQLQFAECPGGLAGAQIARIRALYGSLGFIGGRPGALRP